MLSEKQAEQIKKQLLKNLSYFSEDKRDFIKEKVLSMPLNEFEQFLSENNLLSTECIFCSITENKSHSYKIGENSEAIAVLDINPKSKAHTLIIPKKHSSNFSEKAKELANSVIEKIKSVFNPKDIKIIANKNEHSTLTLLPIYSEDTGKKEDLSEIHSLLTKKQEKPIKIEKEQKTLYKIKPRIP